uniref:Methyltransferase domain-containing protein n=1 Tax=candidate division WOR-3 bacterium TaxID=2052148 RepID=A0A7V1EJ60_UNCW3
MREIYYDELTGIYNRRFLYYWVDNEIKRANRFATKFGIIIIDLDNFREINNNYGHLEGDKVLDVGTGGGLLAIGFARTIKNCEVVGIDIWMRLGGGTSLKIAKRNAEIEGVADKVKFEEGDARNIPYSNGYFDIVVASFAIHIIKRKREEAFQEMIRVLKPGGKFAIIEPSREYRWVVDEKLRETLEEIGLENVKFQPFLVSYPKRRHVYIIYGEKR